MTNFYYFILLAFRPNTNSVVRIPMMYHGQVNIEHDAQELALDMPGWLIDIYQVNQETFNTYCGG